ncbi:dienelactone hydrolase family protein [Solemya velesiana gill symbiont]|uniref:dienelactone hydrolase family protein n=1 Tax=Solemya velesiana gill symbiont TaxID=1918948 RepID=UPI00155FA022|nr:dienelactone hydrolase family protein [Solemya velesiana gill symbiont]
MGGDAPHNIKWANTLAEQVNCQAIVVDLYDTRVTDDPETASTWMREIDQELADKKLLAALEWLEQPNRKLATYGCSFGGKESMQATLLAPEKISATAAAYCRMETDLEKLKTLHGPVLAIYAEQERTMPEKRENFEAAMKDAGKLTKAVSFDAAHGFTNPTKDFGTSKSPKSTRPSTTY